MASKKQWAAAATAAALAGCGGGSIGIGLGYVEHDQAFWVDRDVEVVYMAIRGFDGIAGVERMLATVPDGFERLLGAPAAASQQACPGGGSITTWKQDPGNFRLTATNCRLRTIDTLVYDGVWQFQLTSTANYSAAGTCAAGLVCSAAATIDTSNARFGYGAANLRAFGRSFQIATTAAGVRTFAVTAGNESVVLNDGTPATASGSLAVLDFYAAGVTYRVAGTRQRDRLELTAPYNGTILLGADITARLDRNRDGLVDREFTIPWRTFGS
jgi:hypothetical protein